MRSTLFWRAKSMIALTGLGARITWKGQPLHAVEWPKPERCSMRRNGNHVLMESCPAAALDLTAGSVDEPYLQGVLAAASCTALMSTGFR